MTGRDTPQDDAAADSGDATRGGGGAADASRGRARGEPATQDAAATWFGRLGQLDFDIDFYESLLSRNPSSIEVLRVLAELVSQKGLVARAVELDRRLVAALPNDFLARYNLACSLARAGSPGEAIDSLTRAILLGYDDIDHMETDPDLESLRHLPDFQELLGHGRTG
jgi:tetratricopeptide (TPR) repeat protein